MTDSTPAAVLDLPDEDKAALLTALLQWKADGVANPLIPLDHDVDGDGIVDSFGLDDNDQLVLVPGVHIDTTVSIAVGGDNQDAVGAE